MLKKMALQSWRPDGWWNPIDYMTTSGDGILIDIIFNPHTGEKIGSDEREFMKQALEFGADMVLNSLSELRTRDIIKIMCKVRADKEKDIPENEG